MVIHGTGHLPQDDSIFMQSWLPEQQPRAAIVLVHGLAEHSGRYTEFAEVFTAAGYAVHACDLPGHGHSDGRRCHIWSFDDFISVVEQLTNSVQERHPGLPIVLVGHSMGGLIAAASLIGFQQKFAAAVLSAPAIRAHEQPRAIEIVIARVLSRIVPTLGVMQLDSNGVSRDPETVRRYDNDPLVFRGKVTASLAAELFRGMGEVQEKASAISLPLLLMHGDADVMTAPGGSQLLHDTVSSEQRKFILYPGLYHEIFNEPEGRSVMSDACDWLNGVLSDCQ